MPRAPPIHRCLDTLTAKNLTLHPSQSIFSGQKTAMGELHDVLIIGGGPAGLSAALSLARLLHTVVVFDSGVYRNRFADRMHTLSTWDHQRPADYRAAARKEL